MNSDYLNTFVALSRLGSFSAVAKELDITQPAVSFQIQKLEQELNIKLLNRTSRKLSLTDAGRRVLKYAESMDLEYQKLLRDIDVLRDELVGGLTVASSSTPGEFIVPSILGKYLADHPAVESNVVIMDSQEVIDSVIDGQYEIGFCGSLPPTRKDIAYFKIGSDRIKLIAYPSHPFAKMPSIKFNMLENEPMITREASSGTRQSLEKMIKQAGLNPDIMSHRLMLGSARAMISAVEAGTGLAFVSSFALLDSKTIGAIKTINISDLNLQRDFYCIYAKDKLNSRLIKDFVSFIKDTTSKED